MLAPTQLHPAIIAGHTSRCCVIAPFTVLCLSKQHAAPPCQQCGAHTGVLCHTVTNSSFLLCCACAAGGCPPDGRARMYTIQDTSAVCTVDPATGAPKATGLGPRSANYQVGGCRGVGVQDCDDVEETKHSCSRLQSSSHVAAWVTHKLWAGA